MRRTCERPGCAELASVAFGMVPEDLLVWLEACDPATLGDRRPGLLCRRHADSMSVPMGWTLDDHREPVPRLFKVREVPPVPRAAHDHTGRTRRPRLPQASLLDLVAQEMLDDASAELTRVEASVPAVEGSAVEVAASATIVEPSALSVEPTREPAVATVEAPADDDQPVWAPQFDRSDDLDGLLAPRGKLLRRAFGADPQT